MISEREYKVLKAIKASPKIDELAYRDEKDNLLRLNMIERDWAHVIEDRTISEHYAGLVVTPTGNAAIEDYERLQESIMREKKTLKVAHKANIISVVSLCVSSFLSIPALIVSIISLLQ